MVHWDKESILSVGLYSDYGTLYGYTGSNKISGYFNSDQATSGSTLLNFRFDNKDSW